MPLHHAALTRRLDPCRSVLGSHDQNSALSGRLLRRRPLREANVVRTFFTRNQGAASRHFEPHGSPLRYSRWTSSRSLDSPAFVRDRPRPWTPIAEELQAWPTPSTTLQSWRSTTSSSPPPDDLTAHSNLVQLVRKLALLTPNPRWYEVTWVFCDRCGCSVDTELIHPGGHHYSVEADFYCSDCWEVMTTSV